MQPDPNELENTSLWHLTSWYIGHSAADAAGGELPNANGKDKPEIIHQ